MADSHSHAADQARAEAHLKKILAGIEHEVPLLLFTDSGPNAPFCEASRQVIRMLRQYTPKVTLREYDLSHAEAKKRNITAAPTLLFDREPYRIRWQGAPVGEEARTFIELLLALGRGQVELSEASKKILDHLDSPRDLLIFVSPTCPYCPQQAVNGIKAAVSRPDLVSLTIVDIQMNPAEAERYGAHSVPQAFANDTLIGLGAQSEELFLDSMAKLEQQNVFIPESDAGEIDTDLVIVGGGPAGLTAGIYATRSGLRSVVVEKGALGGQVATTPVVENYPGFTQVGGKTLVDIMVSHALEYTEIFPGEEVVDVTPGVPMVVQTSRRRFTTRAVLLATGASHRKLGVPGEKELAGRGVSYCSTCDGPLFRGKKVVMVGGGNSALTEALHLANIGVEVTIVHRSAAFRAQEHLIKNVEAQNLKVFFDTELASINGSGKVESVGCRTRNGDTFELEAAGVFIAIGYQPATGLARKLGVELTTDGFIKKDARHRTSVPGIYSAGDVEGGYKQIVTAAGQGAEAALAIFEDLMNPYWQREVTK